MNSIEPMDLSRAPPKNVPEEEIGRISGVLSTEDSLESEPVVLVKILLLRVLAAAYEAAGLNPVVLFSQGHAWVGVWICKSDFEHVTEPDVVAVRKAVQAREFVPIESTLLTQRPSIGFDQAVDEGRRRLSEDREPEFVVAVDIARSRAARIRPLASHRVSGPSESVAEDEVAPAALPPLPDFGFLPGESTEEATETPLGRIERWQCPRKRV